MERPWIVFGTIALALMFAPASAADCHQVCKGPLEPVHGIFSAPLALFVVGAILVVVLLAFWRAR